MGENLDSLLSVQMVWCKHMRGVGSEESMIEEFGVWGSQGVALGGLGSVNVSNK